MTFPVTRPRRLRRREGLRRLVRETHLEPAQLVLPLFVVPGSGVHRPLASLPGVAHVSPDEAAALAGRAADRGVGGVLLFGLPSGKDEEGSSSWDDAGPVPEAIRAIRERAPELAIATDVCLCAYTSHGHCGVLAPDGHVLNDATLPLLGRMAVAHARAGADLVAPSDMMDGRVGAIRAALDDAGFAERTAIMAYSTKYASAFYGPFREAADSAPAHGDRRSYQMDVANAVEGVHESLLDQAEGADLLMVKPAGPYLDVIRRLADATPLPIAAYQVSGEHAMMHAAAAAGALDLRAAVLESLVAIRRAGARILITYSAIEVAEWLDPIDDESRRLYAEAVQHIPGGVNSPVRAMRAVGRDHPLFIVEARGAEVIDADGNRYVDYVASWGPMILGHAHPAVIEAVRDAALRGTSYGAPTPSETDLAVRVKRAYPCVELVRFVSSGTEATMSALRLARSATGRDGVLKFAGCYHGHVDALLAQAGSGIATLGIPTTPGVPASAAADTVVVPYNDPDALERAFAAHGDRLACAMVEGVPGNMGCIPPEPGFLELLHALCRKHGALFVVDEVMSGFRVAAGGAVELYGLEPDLVTFGKIVGGGLPAAAFGGPRATMELLAPIGSTYQAGTLSGNPLAMAAGVATLDQLAEPGTYERLEATSARLEDAMRAALGDDGVTINRVGSMLTAFFHPGPVRSYADAAAGDAARFGRLFRHCLAEGVYLAPSAFEAAFVSLAHGEAEIERTAAALRSFAAAERASVPA